ncbi:hypothetical protein RHSIM_RhsimUnG0078700 [Rhododendron simsii]|uniref:Gnk2-homologous domain-containing protein n=1 Tax=Rhododendron simsii TaxID=118357 RepID=A0A834FW75_RHOSS|nr:hypothetical protein RHSIM_RhsimUnG0078700 [Rhododendron simsii]
MVEKQFDTCHLSGKLLPVPHHFLTEKQHQKLILVPTQPVPTQLVMCKSSLVVLLSCIFTSLLPLTSAQYCSYPGNFTSNSTYGINRDRIVSSLMQNVHAHIGFYNGTLGQGSDAVYALGLCRGDLSNITCIYCISKASLDIKLQCPNKIEAVAYGDPYPCIIRYSNESFFGAMDSRPAKFLPGASNITDHTDEFDQALNDLVDRLIIRAAAGNTSLKFAMGTTNYTQDENNTVYGLMQCVPSLSSVDCSRCLRGAVDDYRSCCLRKKAVNIMRPSCLFQYDLSPISESSAGAAPPPPAPSPAHTFAPPTPSTNVTTKQDNKSSTLRIVVVAVSISLVLTALACVLLRLRKRKDIRKVTGKGRTTLQLLDERGTDADLPLFDLITTVATTDNFLLSNKLGQGGFGPVYKAWDLWREGKALDIVLPFLRDQDSFPGPQVLRYIHIGLLCVQEFATDQPNMSKVAFMLCNETALLSLKQRAFIMNGVRKDPASSSTSAGAASSVNDVTLSAIDGR